jgi:hypothetical protein
MGQQIGRNVAWLAAADLVRASGGGHCRHTLCPGLANVLLLLASVAAKATADLNRASVAQDAALGGCASKGIAYRQTGITRDTRSTPGCLSLHASAMFLGLGASGFSLGLLALNFQSLLHNVGPSWIFHSHKNGWSRISHRTDRRARSASRKPQNANARHSKEARHGMPPASCPTLSKCAR